MLAQHRPNTLRHPAADYSDPGAYFVTLCTQNREPLFGEVNAGKLQGNDFSRIVWELWLSLPERFPQISIDAAIVMPDHFHGIIVIHENPHTVEAESVGVIHELPLRQKRRLMTIPLIIGYLKMNTAKHINLLRKTPGERLWQRGYYDRIVRLDREYDSIVEYILTNPLRWGLDKD